VIVPQNYKRSQAAIDLGLAPDDHEDRSLEAFQSRAAALLVDVQISHGTAAAVALFERLVDLARAFVKPKLPDRAVRVRRKPPQKQKGKPHNPREDTNLLALWRHTPYRSKQEFAREIMKRRLVRTIDEKSLVKRLNRLLSTIDRADK
jgi:hypothetical protein